MRIAHVGTSISLNQVVLNQMIRQQEAGHDVVALCPDDEWAEAITAAGVQVIRVPFRRHDWLATLVSAARTWAICRRERFDVVHTHNSLPGVFGRVAAKLAGVPCVVHTCHAWPLHWRRNLLFTWTYRGLERLAARCAHAVLFQNPDDMCSCLDQRVVPPGKAVLIGNGIDVARFLGRVSEGARRRVRSEFGIADAAFVVAMVARLELPKGHAFFLKGLQRLLGTSAREVVALFAGTGRDEEQIRADVACLGLQPSVRFAGYRHDVPDLLLAADASVLTSLFEGVPRVLMESMALGLPVIATDVPGTRMLVRPGETGLLVRHGDVEGLANALTRVMEDPGLAGRLGEAGRQFVRARFEEREVVERILQVYDRVLRAPGSELPRWIDLEVAP